VLVSACRTASQRNPYRSPRRLTGNTIRFQPGRPGRSSDSPIPGCAANHPCHRRMTNRNGDSSRALRSPARNIYAWREPGWRAQRIGVTVGRWLTGCNRMHNARPVPVERRRSCGTARASLGTHILNRTRSHLPGDCATSPYQRSGERHVDRTTAEAAPRWNSFPHTSSRRTSSCIGLQHYTTFRYMKILASDNGMKSSDDAPSVPMGAGLSLRDAAVHRGPPGRSAPRPLDRCSNKPLTLPALHRDTSAALGLIRV